MQNEKLAFTIPESVAASGQSRTAIYMALRRGELVARKRGSRTIILVDELRRWLESLPRLETRSAA